MPATRVEPELCRTRETPKSVSRGVSPWSRTLPGFRSRWIIERLWRCSSPQRAPQVISTADWTEGALPPCLLSQSARVPVRRIFADDHNLAVVFVRVEDRQDVRMPGCLKPAPRFVLDGLQIRLVVDRRLQRNLRGKKLSAPLGEPNHAEAALAELSD